MFLLNSHPDYRSPLDPADIETLGPAGADAISAHLAQRIAPKIPVLPRHAFKVVAAWHREVDHEFSR